MNLNFKKEKDDLEKKLEEMNRKDEDYKKFNAERDELYG